jgi:hypothetical protein
MHLGVTLPTLFSWLCNLYFFSLRLVWLAGRTTTKDQFFFSMDVDLAWYRVIP